VNERRKYPRYDVSHSVVYRDLLGQSEPTSEDETRTEDVSRGGISMRMNRLVEDGSILNLKIQNASYKKPIDADARVVWIKKTMDNATLLGLSFTRIGWIESDKLLTPEIIRV